MSILTGLTIGGKWSYKKSLNPLRWKLKCVFLPCCAGCCWHYLLLTVVCDLREEQLRLLSFISINIDIGITRHTGWPCEDAASDGIFKSGRDVWDGSFPHTLKGTPMLACWSLTSRLQNCVCLSHPACNLFYQSRIIQVPIKLCHEDKESGRMQVEATLELNCLWFQLLL